MADFRPLRGLRYRPDAVGDLGSVLSPPFDVIDAEEHAALLESNPYNVIRLELSEERPGDGPEENRYTRAAATLREWRSSGVLHQEEQPAFYVYAQEYEHEGQRLRRRSLIGRVRVEPWESGSVLPHEETMAAPKEDRLQVLHHLHANISPIFALYRDVEGRIDGLLPGDGARLIDDATPDAQRHTLFAISDHDTIEGISSALRDTPLYMLDGHHRFETALAYRNERASRAASWTGEEPENFVMVAITCVDDPGLTLLPIHRLVRPPAVPANLAQELERFFDVEDAASLPDLLDRLAAARSSGTAFGAIGPEDGKFRLLALRDVEAARSLMPPRSDVWRGLDVSVLEFAVLREILGVEAGATGALTYTEHAERALEEVESGRWPLAFILNPTRFDQILEVADADERMPAKSTFFFPKLATGIVLNPFD